MYNTPAGGPSNLGSSIVIDDQGHIWVGSSRDTFGGRDNGSISEFDGQIMEKELRRLKKELTKEEYKELKGVMWAYRKKKADLSPTETDLLDRFFAYSPAAQKAYDLRED